MSKQKKYFRFEQKNSDKRQFYLGLRKEVRMT